MVGLLSSLGLGTWETWMSDSLQGLAVDWFVEQVGVGQLGKLGCQILYRVLRLIGFFKRDHCTALWAVQHPSMTPTEFVSGVC